MLFVLLCVPLYVRKPSQLPGLPTSLPMCSPDAHHSPLAHLSSAMQVPPAMDTFGLAAEASGQTSTSSTGLLEAAAMAQQQQQQQEQQQQAAMASFAAAAAAAAGMYPGGGMPGAGMPGVQPMMGMAGAPLPAMPGAPPGLPLPADPTGEGKLSGMPVQHHNLTCLPA